jgi:hypothetical protein
MSRFVILRHDTPHGYIRPTHWDLMLADGEHLLTWALREMPHVNCETDAEQLGSHRIEYLDIEGPLSGNRGRVERIDAGKFEWLVREKDRITIALHGETLQGTAQLTRHDDQSWRFLLRDVSS